MIRPFRHVLYALALGACLIDHAHAQPAGGPPIDPRAMSGIPRVDPQTEPGTITVRCLRGSFKDPAVGVTVKLELRSADGGKLETRTLVAGADGRASFTELAPYYGGVAVASVDFDGEQVSSQTITPSPAEGVRVLLVQGATSAAATATPPPAATPGAPDVPMPGTPFATPNAPRGTVLVGALDLRSGGPVVGAKVRLKITRSDAPEETREALSDARGTARFTGLETLPADAVLVAEADLATGTQRSQSFTLAGRESGLAVVLAVVAARAAAREAARRPLSPPRAFPTIPAGTVRVTLIDGADQPLPEVPLVVVRRDASGLSARFEGATGEDGVARVTDVDVGDDGLYQVEATYDGAPWHSRFFRMDERMGVAVELRLFKVSSDPTLVRAAVQFNVQPLENDMARVVQFFQVHVDGDKAFWVEPPLRLSAGEGATEMAVLDRADDVLEHDRKSPFATLSSPLPPGEVVDLSIGYIVPHHGEVDVRWTSPFPVIEARAVLSDDLRLTRGSKGPAKRPPHEQPGAAELDMYELGAAPLGKAYDLRVEGLTVQPRLYRHLGLGLGLAVALASLLAFALRPRAALRARLLRRRDELLRELDGAAPAARPPLVAELDRVYYQLDALGGGGSRHVDPGAAWSGQRP